jgi:hypothetical protein
MFFLRLQEGGVGCGVDSASDGQASRLLKDLDGGGGAASGNAVSSSDVEPRVAASGCERVEQLLRSSHVHGAGTAGAGRSGHRAGARQTRRAARVPARRSSHVSRKSGKVRVGARRAQVPHLLALASIGVAVT